jgi:hypothetical protein
MVVVVTHLQPESRVLWVQPELPVVLHMSVVSLDILTTVKFKIHTQLVSPLQRVVLVEREEMEETAVLELQVPVVRGQQAPPVVPAALRLVVELLD